LETVEGILEDALSAWQEGSQLLDSLPSLSPDHETARLAVASLRSVYEDTIARRHHGASMLTSSREQIAAAQQTLDSVRGRSGKDTGNGVGSGTTIEQIERTIAQAEALLEQMPPYSAERDRIQSAIIELRQLETMADAGPGLGPSDALVRRKIVETQLTIARAVESSPDRLRLRRRSTE
jgi:exonuclease VII small subunit